MPVLVPFIIGALSLGVMTVVRLDGPIETLAVLIEALWIFLVGRLMITRDSQIPILLIPFIAPILLSLRSIESPLWEHGLFHLDALVLEAMIGVSVLVAWYMSKLHPSILSFRHDFVEDLEHTAWIVASLYGLVFIWLVGHALLPGSYATGTALSVALYMFIALAVYMVGRVLHAAWKSLAAGVVAGLAFTLALVIHGTIVGAAVTTSTLILVVGLLITLAWFEKETILSTRRWWKW